MPLIRVADVTLHVAEAGGGEPLVLLHGFTGSSAQWSAHTVVFGREYLMLSVDLLGHGSSDAPVDPERYGMTRCVADLATLLDQLRVERAVWLGYSMGGRVALAFALAHPQRVRALILEGASPGIADPEERRVRRTADEALATTIEREGIEAFVDAWIRQPLFASQARLDESTLAAEHAARRANDPVGLANSLRGLGAGAQASFWSQLSTLAVPTLLVVGEEDQKFRTIAAAMAARIARAEVTLIPNAGHTAHLESPRAFQNSVLEFLGRIAVSDQPSAGQGSNEQ